MAVLSLARSTLRRGSRGISAVILEEIAIVEHLRQMLHEGENLVKRDQGMANHTRGNVSHAPTPNLARGVEGP